MVNLKVNLAGIEIDNPVIPASGTFGYGQEFAQLYDINCLAKDVPAIEAGSAHEAGPVMMVPILILAAACLLMGLFPQWLLDIIREAVML